MGHALKLIKKIIFKYHESAFSMIIPPAAAATADICSSAAARKILDVFRRFSMFRTFSDVLNRFGPFSDALLSKTGKSSDSTIIKFSHKSVPMQITAYFGKKSSERGANGYYNFLTNMEGCSDFQLQDC